MKTKKQPDILTLAQFSILLAIEAIFCFTPLGSIPFTPAIVATLAMVPVVITAILLGTGAGAAMGFIAGLFSFIIWTFTPPNPLFAFVFTPFYSMGEMQGNGFSLVICFVPRILTGVVAGAVHSAMIKRFPQKEVPAYALSGVLASMTNTILVLGLTYVFFGRQYAEVMNAAYGLLLGILGLTVVTNGIPEALINMVAASFVCKPLKKILSRHKH